jgi:hypothetical protein
MWRSAAMVIYIGDETMQIYDELRQLFDDEEESEGLNFKTLKKFERKKNK